MRLNQVNTDTAIGMKNPVDLYGPTKECHNTEPLRQVGDVRDFLYMGLKIIIVSWENQKIQVQLWWLVTNVILKKLQFHFYFPMSSGKLI